MVQQDHQQVQVTSMQQTSDLKVEPALYNSAYLRVNSPERKGARAPQVRQESSLESLAMLSSGFTPGVATTKPTPNFDTLMKPQVHDYMNMQKSYDINNPGKKSRYKTRNRGTKGMAERTQKESLSFKTRENHVYTNYQDDNDTSMYMVC